MGASNPHHPGHASQSCVNALKKLYSPNSAVADSKCGYSESNTPATHSVGHSAEISLGDTKHQLDYPTEEYNVISRPQITGTHPSPKVEKRQLCRRAKLPSNANPDAESFHLWFASMRPRLGAEAIRCFYEAYNTPPISSSSLAELEISSIIGNPKLRHDINFDYELHFRPNNDGEQGHRKQQLAVDYWRALETELEIYGFMLADPAGSLYRWTPMWTQEFKKYQKRIPRAFAAIREILLAMAPDRDRSHVEEALDVGLIMQQVEHGSADLASVALWLATFLKRHCAPVRDKWVDQMVRHISRGVQESDPGTTVKGLKMLFGILEAMKLDIANHQIRHLRPVLLNATTHFEQIFNERRIETGQVDADGAMRWYSQPMIHTLDTVIADSHLTHFIHSLVWTLLPLDAFQGPPFQLPQTFRLDYGRIRSIRADIFSFVREEICVLWVRQLCRMLGHSVNQVVGTVKRFRAVLPVIMGNSSWYEAHENIAAELIRLVLTTSEPAPALDDATTRRQTDHDKRRSYAVFSEPVRWLRSNLAENSPVFQRQLHTVRENIIKDVLSMAERHVKMSPIEMFDSLVSGMDEGSSQNKPAGIEMQLTRRTVATSSLNGRDVDLGSPSLRNSGGIDRFDDICRRLTHIAALHWNVWAPILYLNDGSGSDGEGSDVETESATGTNDSASQDDDEDAEPVAEDEAEPGERGDGKG